MRLDVDDLDRRIAALPRERLIALPTPLDRADRLGGQLGVELLIKRDDLTGIGLGGNKLRKLEFIVGDAIGAGVDTLLTTGGLQSNHARLTAAVAARTGMSCELYLKGEATIAKTGNLLLDELFGASVNFCGVINYVDIHARMAARALELARSGRKALVVPLGGATACGTLGYTLAFREILDQLGDGESQDTPLTVALSGGTGSTAAGLVLGATLWAPQTNIFVVSASWTQATLTAEIRRCATEAASLLGVAEPSLSRVHIDDGHVGPGYAKPSEEGCRAIRRVAVTEGIVLDTTYTGKAMSGLITAIESRNPAPGARVVFLHSGGTPEIFTRTALDLGL